MEPQAQTATTPAKDPCLFHSPVVHDKMNPGTKDGDPKEQDHRIRKTVIGGLS